MNDWSYADSDGGCATIFESANGLDAENIASVGSDVELEAVANVARIANGKFIDRRNADTI